MSDDPSSLRYRLVQRSVRSPLGSDRGGPLDYGPALR
jgi:hypothetical protein